MSARPGRHHDRTCLAGALSLGVLALTACGDASSSEGTAWRGTTVDSAGAVLVLNPAEGLWSGEAAWAVVEELRVGAFAGDPDLQFGQVGSIAVNSVGDMFVVDRQIPTVRVFGADGAFLRRIGEPGSGPGEFAPAVTDVFVGAGDTLLVPDVRNRRIHRFGPDGAFLDDTRLDADAGRPLRFRWNPATGRGVVQLRPLGGAGALEDLEDELRLVRPDGGFGRLLRTIPSGGLFGTDDRITYFTPEPVWGVTDSLTVLFGSNDAYRIAAYASDGSLQRVLTLPHTPRAVTERDIDAFFVYLDAQWRALGVPEAQLPRRRELVRFSETFPAFYQFFTGPAGTLWVQPVQPPGELSDEQLEHYNFLEDFGASDWDVFDGEGRFLGRVAMPPRFQPRLFVDDLIYGVVRDEFDVQYVARMRIEVTSDPNR